MVSGQPTFSGSSVFCPAPPHPSFFLLPFFCRLPSFVSGTYNRNIFSGEAVRLIEQHDTSESIFMYLAFMNVHDGCTRRMPLEKGGRQAPLATVQRFGNIEQDTYKVTAAMYSELDQGVSDVIDALKRKKMWDNTLIIYVSDNGARGK